DFRGVVRKARRLRNPLAYIDWVVLAFPGFVQRLAAPQKLHASVSARQCANDACSKLGPAASDTITIELPKELSVQAPRRALFGQPVTFTGTGVPGNTIEIDSTVKPGSAPLCGVGSNPLSN